MKPETPMTWNTATSADQQSLAPEIVFDAGLRHHHIANTAYPIHHQTTMRPYRVSRSEIERMASAAWQTADRLGLYVHVPFCAQRCAYCEYTVNEHSTEDLQEAYFGALDGEFQLYRERLATANKTLIGFDIGGGTPSFVDPVYIARILRAAHSSFRFASGMAISIETTPTIAMRMPERIRAYREMGIDRISMGVQTTHFQLAQSLGREYSGPAMLQSAVHNIRSAGYSRFNIDLMYGFPDQSPASWQRTLQQTISLEPEYITLYQMRYKGTRLQDQAALVTRPQISDLRSIARECLLAGGYSGTWGKNTYSRIQGDPGTSDYLTERVIKGTPYLGLGSGAQSLSQYTLSYNHGAASKALAPYLRAVQAGELPLQDVYHLPIEVAMGKMISVSFYFGQIHRAHFHEKFGVRLEEHFAPEVAFVLERGLMENVGPYMRLTSKGVQYCNGVIALFYAAAVKNYLVHLEPAPALAPAQRAA